MVMHSHVPWVIAGQLSCSHPLFMALLLVLKTRQDEPTSQGASTSAPGGTGMDVDSDDGYDTPE